MVLECKERTWDSETNTTYWCFLSRVRADTINVSLCRLVHVSCSLVGTTISLVFLVSRSLYWTVRCHINFWNKRLLHFRFLAFEAGRFDRRAGVKGCPRSWRRRWTQTFFMDRFWCVSIFDLARLEWWSSVNDNLWGRWWRRPAALSRGTLGLWRQSVGGFVHGVLRALWWVTGSTGSQGSLGLWPGSRGWRGTHVTRPISVCRVSRLFLKTEHHYMLQNGRSLFTTIHMYKFSWMFHAQNTIMVDVAFQWWH